MILIKGMLVACRSVFFTLLLLACSWQSSWLNTMGLWLVTTHKCITGHPALLRCVVIRLPYAPQMELAPLKKE